MDDEIETIYYTKDGLGFKNREAAQQHAKLLRDVKGFVEAYGWSNMSKNDLVQFIMEHSTILHNILRRDSAERQSESST